jgi:ribonuclease D
LPDAHWRIRGAFDLDPKQAAVLKELCEYREQVARASDRPVFKIISDRALLAIATAIPENLDGLRWLSEFSDQQVHRYGNDILRAVQRGVYAPPLHPPRVSRPDEDYLFRLEALREWRKKAALRMQVKSDVVLPRDLLNSIAARNPANRKELADLLTQVPYRLERFGEQILATLSDS